MRLRRSALAIADGNHIRDYIAADNPRAAIDMDERLWKAAVSLKHFPQKGRSGKVKGTRERPVAGTPYILAYRIQGEAIRIVRIMHGAQRWPKTMPQL